MANKLIQLSPAEVEELGQAERILHDLLPLLDVADNCGVECQIIREQVAQMQEQIRLLRENFSPVK